MAKPLTYRSYQNRAREVRLRYMYRKIVTQGKVHLPLEAAIRLVGPDCAYHLYGASQGSATKGKRNKK